MKCSGSPTTCTAPSARDAAAEFAGVLVASAFAPLAKSMGFFGDAVIAAAARSVARAERGGLTDALERTIER